MLVVSVNKILHWCQIVSGGRNYTCPTKVTDGSLYFHFKKEWHKVADYLFEHADELVEIGGKAFLRKYRE